MPREKKGSLLDIAFTPVGDLTENRSLRQRRRLRVANRRDGAWERAETDRVGAAVVRSTNGREDVYYDIISNISSLENSSLRQRRRLREAHRRDGAWEREETDRVGAAAVSSTNGRQEVYYDITGYGG